LPFYLEHLLLACTHYSNRDAPAPNFEGFASKVKMHLFGQWGFSLMPQRGYGLQPRVAASATLGTSKKRDFNRNAVASISQREMHKIDATALRLRTRSLSLPRVAEA